jgi:Flp pilus assembly protein TadD
MKMWIIVGLAALVASDTAAQEQAATPAAAAQVFQQVSGLIEEDRTTEAVSLLEAAVRDDSPAQLVAMLGALYVEVGRPSDGLRTLQPLAEGADADPAVLYNAGRAALAMGERDLGRRYLERSVGLEPDSPASRELGMLRAATGEFMDAYLLLKPWSERDPDDRQARIVGALCAAQLNRPDEALALLEGLDAEDPQVALLLASARLKKADYWGAVNVLEPVQESAPEVMQLDIARTLAEGYVAIGQAEKAVAVLTGRVGDDAAVALQLGLAQYQSGDAEGALATLTPFADRARPDLEQDVLPAGTPRRLAIEYGRLLATVGRPADALPFLDAATRLEPEDKQTWHQLGQALAALGRTDEALVALDRFQQIVADEQPSSVRDLEQEESAEDPTGSELRRANSLVAEERLEEALAIARQEAVLAPGDIRPFLLEARILLTLGRLDEALERAEAIVSAADGSADAHYIRGAILMAFDRIEPAEADFRLALARSAEHMGALNDLAVLLIQKGDRGGARELLDRALKLRPNDPLTAANLARLDESP